MPSLRDQLEWETTMISRGVERYRKQQADAKESRPHESSSGSRLLKSYVLRISDQIKLYQEGKHPTRRRNKFSRLLGTVDTDKVAMIALRTLIGGFFNDGAPLASTCSTIGRRCEDELRMTKFHLEYAEYYESLIRDFERKNVQSYRHKKRVLTKKSNDKGLEWKAWSDEEAFGVGALVVSLLMEVCDLVERKDNGVAKKVHGSFKKPEAKIGPTEACLDWIRRHDDLVELTSPDRMPCIVPPADWVSVTDGGFWSPNLRKRTPLIKWRSLGELKKDLYSTADMPQVLSAVNAMQKTGWRINKRVMDVMQEVWSKNLGCGMPRSEPYEFPECPLEPGQRPTDLPEGSAIHDAFVEWKEATRELHTMEKERVSKNIALVRTMRIARELRELEAFWYVYQCDFRGRVYAASSGLTPQGADQSKGLLEFFSEKALGSEEGVKWFLVNGANKFGYDKCSYEDRVKWVWTNEPFFIQAADDPIAFKKYWENADKPYQFLAWIFEFADFVKGGKSKDFLSRLPVGLDGSCNGLQHFSAMLRDEVGGKSVNLVPGSAPADIYQDVADVLQKKLQVCGELGEAPALNWLRALKGKVPRALTKKPVMTLPYGSTQQACTGSIYSYIMDKHPEDFDHNARFKHAIYLTPLLWEAISEVVIAARAAMDWIQDCSSCMSSQNLPIVYESPLGFPVVQSSMKYVSKQIETQICGRIRVSLASKTEDIDPRKQRQGSSPNLVHHADAAHMMMVINDCVDKGITNFAMIHDDFGTHAADAANMQESIRAQFIALHTATDLLESFRDRLSESSDAPLPKTPQKGSLNLEEVYNSDYFFG